ncbi:DNA-processing protein DprA [Modestobacter sp. DSM 44400]|uniref:DNA-processing protein DprA n=1 Tax=Modestobacter sp. DSM 44400 TaxID=1550230 RepID=UPI00352A8CB5
MDRRQRRRLWHDAAAHRGAIAAPGTTVVVTAGGLDRPYPSAHAALFERVVEGGGLLVSQYPLGAAPISVRFRHRSALLAALSTAVVVVEAAARSSALSAVHAAQAIARPVFAAPGPVTSTC